MIIVVWSVCLVIDSVIMSGLFLGWVPSYIHSQSQSSIGFLDVQIALDVFRYFRGKIVIGTVVLSSILLWRFTLSENLGGPRKT